MHLSSLHRVSPPDQAPVSHIPHLYLTLTNQNAQGQTASFTQSSKGLCQSQQEAAKAIFLQILWWHGQAYPRHP